MEEAIIDTSIVIDILRGRGRKYEEILKRYCIHISAITCFEIYYGIFKKGSKKERKIFEKFLEGVFLDEMDCKTMEMAAFISRFFERKGEKICNEDAIIMATGIINGFKIITKDKKWKLLEEIYPRIYIIGD